MRFVIAVILVALYVFVSLVTTKGIEGIGMLISYLIGTLLAPAIVASLFCIPKSGRNNKRFFRVFNVVLLLVIFGQLGDVAKFIEETSKPPRTIIGLKNKIEIVVPGSWVSKEAPNEHVVLNISNASGYVNIIVGYEYTGLDRLELEHYAQLMGTKYKEGVPEFESISAIKNCGSTGLDCVYQIVNTTTGKKGTTTILATLSGKDGYYNFMAVTNPGLLDTYKEDIFNALRSLNEIN